MADVEKRNVDLSELHPRVRAAVQATLTDLAAAGIPLFVFEAFRSPARQNHLFAQGRTRPGKIVTYTPAWGSYHQYGLAVDFVFGGPGKWTWDEPKTGMWKKFHAIGVRHGLMPLDFETPHLQIAGWSSDALREGRYPAGGDPAWAAHLALVIKAWRGAPDAPPPPAKTGAVSARLLQPLQLSARDTDRDLDRAIAEFAESSAIAGYQWKDRGRAPKGYTKGMAVAYARHYARLKADDPVAKGQARKSTGAASDVLEWYRAKLEALGLTVDKSGVAALRALFVVLLGLGMRESSGRHCEGRDLDADNTTGPKAEAGVFQTSYDIIGNDADLAEIFTRHAAGQDTLRDVFAEGVSCSAAEWKDHGSGPGVGFQKLSKAAPYFAVEITLAAMRKRRSHWGPLTARKAEVKADAVRLFEGVESIVDAV